MKGLCLALHKKNYWSFNTFPKQNSFWDAKYYTMVSGIAIHTRKNSHKNFNKGKFQKKGLWHNTASFLLSLLLFFFQWNQLTISIRILFKERMYLYKKAINLEISIDEDYIAANILSSLKVCWSNRVTVVWESQINESHWQ